MKTLVVGALALAALVATPSSTTWSASSLAGPLEADLVSDSLAFTGDAALTARGGALVGHGAFEGSLFARELRLESYRDDQTTIHVGGFQFTDHYYHEPTSTVLTNASVRFSGHADGIVYVVLDEAELRVALPPLVDETVFASSSQWAFENAAIHHGEAHPGPLVGFKHDPGRKLPAARQGGGGLVPTSVYEVNYSFPEVPIERLEVHAAPRFSLDNATIRIDHDGGHLELRAERRGRDVVAVDRGEVSEYLFLPADGTLEITVGDAGVAFVSPRTTLHVKGSATFPETRGRLALDGARNLRGDALELEGDLTFVLAPVAASEVGGAPRLASSGSGEATSARVNGAALTKLVPVEAPARIAWAEALLAGIFLAWLALSSGAIGLFIRDPTANPRRAAIVAALRRAHFRHLRGLQRDTGLPIGSLAYHLAILRRMGAVRTIRCDNRDVYFLANGELAPAEAAALCVLASEATSRVADALALGGPATQEELAARLALDRSSVSRHVRRLVKSGLVKAVEGASSRYHAEPVLLRWVRTRRST